MAGQTEKWLVITGHSSLFAALLRLLQQKMSVSNVRLSVYGWVSKTVLYV